MLKKMNKRKLPKEMIKSVHKEMKAKKREKVKALYLKHLSKCEKQDIFAKKKLKKMKEESTESSFDVYGFAQKIRNDFFNRNLRRPSIRNEPNSAIDLIKKIQFSERISHKKTFSQKFSLTPIKPAKRSLLCTKQTETQRTLL